jgi:hypothetical protein
MWFAIPIALVGLAVLVVRNRRNQEPERAPAVVTTEKVNRDYAAMALQLHQSGKRYGIWRLQAGVLLPLMFGDDPGITNQFRSLPLNPNQVLYLWDRNHSDSKPLQSRARLLS